MPNTRPRASSSASENAGLVDLARKVTESVARDLQKRLPAELVRQVERSVGQGQKAMQASLRQVEARVSRTASQQDVDRLTRRIDELSRQVNKLVGGGR